MSAESVTLEQQEALMEFLESHKELALGRFSRTKEGRSLSKRLWAECADILNSISANCPSRGAEAWRSYYADYKSKLLKKIKRNKQELSATGGGQYSQLNLTALQERLYNILGRDVGEPLTGVRHNPLDVTFETEGGDGGEEINVIEVPWDRENLATISTSYSLGHDGAMATTSSAAWDVPIMEAMDTSIATMATTTAAMATTTAAMATTTAAMATTTAAIATTNAAMATTNAAMATTTAAMTTTTAATATTVPRRTEPRRRRRSRSRRRLREHEPEMTPLESAEQRLAAMESRSADATFALAQAINRLAEAVEDHRRRPIEVVIVGDHEDQSRRHRRILTSSSDSDD